MDASGNVYLGGYFNTASLTTPSLSKIGSFDAFAFKLDAAGATTWAKNYGGSGASAYGNAIAVDASGNVYLGGYFTTANLTTPALSKIGTNDAFAFKLDGGGATTWAKNYGGSGVTAYGNAIAVDGSGNVYVGGRFTNANLTTPALTKIGVEDAFAFKLDTDGATTWAKNYGGSGAYAQSNGIAVDSSGNVYVGGYFRNANLTTPALTVIGARDAFAFKLDSGGATTWAKNFGGSGATTQGFPIAVDSSGNVFLGGYYYGANLTTPALSKIGTYDAFAFKLNAAGATTWARSYGGSGASAFGYAIAADSSGNMVLGGYFQSGNLTTPALTRGGSKDALVIRVLPATSPDAPTGISVTAGNAQATVTFTAPASNGGAAITSYTVTSSGGQTASGASSPLTVTGLTNGVAYTFTVTATNSAGTGSASSASPSVTVGVAVASPTINEDADSGAIAITGATNNYKITAISGGTLYSDNSYTTAINSGDFIATAGATTNVYFRPTANFNGAAGFSVQGSSSASDAGLTGNTAVSTITVTAVKDAPTGLGNLTLAAVEQGVTSPAGAAISALTGLNFTFVDAGSTLGGVAVVANLANAATQGAWQYSTNAGANWYNIGVVGDNATALALSAATKVRFLPVASFSGTPTALTVRALDNTYVAGYSVAAGTETRVTLNAAVNGGTTAVSGNTNTISTSVTALPPPQNTAVPSNSTTLPSGGGTAAPGGGQTVIVTDNGSNGSSITLPAPTTTTGGATTVHTIKVELPNNTGTVNVASNSAGAKLGVQNTILPGGTTTVTTVTVDQGSASFTATKKDQPLAGLKNGIIVVSGTDSSKVTVDTTGINAKIGVNTSDTIVVPTGSTNVGGTKVDLPPPTASGGKADTVNLNIGGQELTIRSTQTNTTMTFEMKNIGGVQTPVLAVTGNAQVTSSGEDKPIVSIAGNVIKTGKSSGGGSRQVCNTIVQASSDASSDVVHVVTCYIVLEPGTFSALSGGVGNSFAAIKDGIVWAGETAEFDKNGAVIGAYLGTKEGTTSAVGDDIVPGGNKFAVNGYTNNAFIPRLTGSSLRLNEATLDARLFSVFNTALNAATLPATPSQSAQGILNFQVNGGANSLQKAQSTLTFDLLGDTVSVFPSKRIRVDTARADGITVSNEGNVEVATGGLVTTFVPTVADPQGFAADIATLFPGAVSEMRWNGSWKVTTSDGRMFVGRPQWGIQSSASGNGFAAQADGTVTYSINGRTQVLFPDFHDYTTLLATFSKELNDPNLKVAPRMNGSVQATVNGTTYLLYPLWTLIPASQITNKPSWWLDNGVVYIKNADGTAQGFAVK